MVLFFGSAFRLSPARCAESRLCKDSESIERESIGEGAETGETAAESAGGISCANNKTGTDRWKKPNKHKNFKFTTPFFSFTEKFSILRKITVLRKNNRNIVKNIIRTGFIAVLFLFGSFSAVEVKDVKVDVVVIDAGHGGKDTGARGAVSIEKDVALSIALELGKIIEEYLKDVKVIYTRDKDEFIGLKERAAVANKNGADIFISIHCNAVEANKDKSYGTETWVMGLHKTATNFEIAKRENSVILLEENNLEKYEGFDPNDPESYILFALSQNAYLTNSLNMAHKVETQFKERVGRYSRGVKQAGFVVLYETTMPSVLIETGFITNSKEEKYLNDKLGQTYIASGIFRALRDYKNEIESVN